ncbi:restriction endonuclease subunit S [Celeribacter ethanolicus]|uniref:Restriction endonuclease subunit S n=1 Tax=Celeribacter ethanolicus TaxID=1758178 RepID=A0A291GBL3_9RHOB|nr:restriction endonuclease subunit S [Celeribacter ethanolicus]ATG47789.1 restriction endonuclease subunit S [Celeribacter ethanolicus]
MSGFATVPAAPGIPAFRARFLFRQQRERARTTDAQLTASQAYGVIAQARYNELSDTRATAALAGTDNFLHVEVDDFVISLRTFEGGIERAMEAGCISPAYTVMRPTDRVAPDFFRYLLKSSAFIQTLQTAVTGIRDGKSVRYEQFADLVLPTPDLPTQKRIAAFLDRETARIDELIAKKEHLLSALDAKLRAAITKAVTQGANSDAEMKDSGVDWIGQVPTHWSITKLGYLGRCANGINIGGDAFGSGFPFISYGDVYKNRVLPNTGSGLVQSSVSDRASYTVRAGDVFFTRTSETIDEVGFSSVCMETIENAVFAGFLIRFRPSKGKLHPLFSKFAFQHSGLRDYFAKEMNLITRASLSQDLLRNMPVVLPPMEEQEIIGQHLEKLEAATRTISKKTRETIEKLKERRAALITAAVTGQIDEDTYGKAGNTSETLDRIEEEMQA